MEVPPQESSNQRRVVPDPPEAERVMVDWVPTQYGLRLEDAARLERRDW